MKIGIVSPYYMHRPGGVQTLLIELRKALIAKGHTAVLIAPRPRSASDVAKTPPHVHLIGSSAEIKFGAPFHTTHPVAAASKKEIDDYLAEQDFDVINVHEPWMPILPARITSLAKVPVVGTLHARWPRSPLNKSLEKARARYVRGVISNLAAITAGSSVSAANAYEADKDAVVRIIPNAIHVADWSADVQAARSSSCSPYILFLGRLEKRKGPMLLLKAYRKLAEAYPEDTPRLILAGGGPMRKKLEEYAIKHELDSVEFEGFVSDERKAELFANARLYVSPAPFGESFGIVLVEAMAAQLPVVAGNNEGYQTVLSGGGSQSLVDPRDESAFAERMHLMTHNEGLRQSWLEWASQSIGQYDFENYASKHLEVFEQVAS